MEYQETKKFGTRNHKSFKKKKKKKLKQNKSEKVTNENDNETP